MIVTFTKVNEGRGCAWEALRTKRRRTTGHMGVGFKDLPHDLAQFAVESELKLDRGFWGSIAAGATFKSTDRKVTPQGKAVVQANAQQLDEAETLANAHWTAWKEGRSTPVAAAFDALLAGWIALPDGGSLRLEWPSGRLAPYGPA